jgi:octaprenyl-diphosphate synthase
MSHVVNGKPIASALGLLYAPIERELAEVDQILRDELQNEDPFVDELVKYGFRISGKRLRPALLLLAARAVSEIRREHLILAAVVEMIHTATLVHDDVLDEAELRRHLDTVNARWNNESSVLLGDYLFTHSFYLASTVGSTYACRTIGQSTNIVCAGELRQVRHSGNYLLSEAEYLSIIDAKTAELTACSCRLGAHYALAEKNGGNEVEERLASYGRNLGIAFQIADDLLDVTGDEAATGKSLGTDLNKRKATLPIIRLLQLAAPTERGDVLAILEQGAAGAGELQAWLARFEAIDYARETAQRYALAARDDLEGLPASDAAGVLAKLAEFVVARKT